MRNKSSLVGRLLIAGVSAHPACFEEANGSMDNLIVGNKAPSPHAREPGCLRSCPASFTSRKLFQNGSGQGSLKRPKAAGTIPES